MHCRYYRPQQPLTSYVRAFWRSEGDQPSHALERHLPDGAMQLIFNLRDESFRLYERQRPDAPILVRGPLLTGPRSAYTLLDTTQHASLLGVQFRPGGASAILGMPASEVQNTDVSLAALWGATAADMTDQVMGAATVEDQFHLLEAALTARVARYPAAHPAVAFALQEFHTASERQTVAQVTDRIGLSPRRFIQVFREAVGLPPKVYLRVQRFQAALDILGATQTIRLSEVAASCGYYDQAHFIHDFRAISGFTPSTYLTHRGAHQNHAQIAVL